MVRFRKDLPDGEIIERLGKWNFDALQTSRREDESKPPKYTIDRMYQYAEVRATYDRSEQLAELIWVALRDPVVVECTPIYFSPRD
jgi:hypothetical protein